MSLIIRILIAAGAISVLYGERLDAGIILSIVVPNAIRLCKNYFGSMNIPEILKISGMCFTKSDFLHILQ